MKSAPLLLCLLAGCPGGDAGIDARGDMAIDAAFDAASDAPIDGGRCAGEQFLTGEYVDWDSTETNFHGVANATFDFDDDSDPAHTDLTSPNGRAELCLPLTGRHRITITPASGQTYLVGHFVADADVFATGRIFSLRGLTPTRAASFYQGFGLTFDAGKPQLYVNVSGTPTAITLTGATAEKTLVFDKTQNLWTEGGTNTGTGNLVLFTNLSGQAPVIGGATVGNGAVTALPGELTMITVVGAP